MNSHMRMKFFFKVFIVRPSEHLDLYDNLPYIVRWIAVRKAGGSSACICKQPKTQGSCGAVCERAYGRVENRGGAQ